MEKYTLAVVGPLTEMWAKVLTYLPDVVGAFVIFIIGLVVAGLLGKAARRVVSLLHIDEGAQKVGLTSTMHSAGLTFTFEALIGAFVKYFLLLVFVIAAINTLGLTQLTAILNEFLFYLPNVLIAFLIIAAAMAFGDLIKSAATNMAASTALSNRDAAVFGTMAKVGVMLIAVLAALSQLGIAENLVFILFAGIVFALALGFGLGSKDHFSRFLSELSNKSDS